MSCYNQTASVTTCTTLRNSFFWCDYYYVDLESEDPQCGWSYVITEVEVDKSDNKEININLKSGEFCGFNIFNALT